MKSFFLKHEVWIFLVSIVLANVIFVTGVVIGVLPLQIYQLGRFALLAFILLSLIILIRGFNGIWEVLQPMLEWRRSPWLYLFAIGWTTLLCLVVLLAKGCLTGDFLKLGDLIPGLKKLTDPSILRVLITSSFAGEIVWISYALRKLSKCYTYYVSALIVGAFWTMWWLPMAYHNFGIIPNLPLGALLINQTGIAVMCAFLYYHTTSALLVFVLQFVFNSTILIFPVTPDDGGPLTYWGFALTYLSAATLLCLRFGPKPLFRKKNGKHVIPHQPLLHRTTP